jgi:hypothetical protein
VGPRPELEAAREGLRGGTDCSGSISPVWTAKTAGMGHPTPAAGLLEMLAEMAFG